MGIYVNTNVSSLKGRNYLENVNNSLNTTYQRLSSGLRINSAKDDAAGLQISDRLTTQVNGLNQANRNANDAIALAQTMEGGLDEITNMLQRMRTLAVQSSNGINTQEDRYAISQEAGQLTLEIQRIAEKTTYGGKTILMGNAGGTDTNSIFGASGTAINAGDKGVGKISFQVGANSGDSINLELGSFQFSIFAQRATKQGDASALTSWGMASVGSGTGIGGITKDSTKASKNFYAFKLSIADDAAKAISAFDKMLADVDSQRANLGSIQNRLESLIRVNSNIVTNESDARSRIRDTDFAEESANLSQQSIIQQAATSMLMQANSRPQIGLSLLG